MPEEYFSLSDTVLANLSVLTEKQSVLEERRICEIAELAYSTAVIARELVFSEGMSYIEVVSYISETCMFSKAEPHSNALSQNIDIIKAFLSTVVGADKSIFARLLVEKLIGFGLDITEREFLLTKNLPEKFVYVKNSFSDEAYDFLLTKYELNRK